MLESEANTLEIGRYVLHRQIARGGMATIHIARLMGDEGFSRIVAAKRLLPEFAEDSEFVAMFLDEARIASRVSHRNVVPVLDVVTCMDEVVLVQEYVHGAPLHWLLNRARQAEQHVPVPIAVSIATQILAGLHAAHELVDETNTPLNVVHRDVSPQNVMIAVDGTARLLDFGVAKATMAAHITREGTYKGKLAYSAPEQLRGAATRQSDLYSLSVMLWELLVGHRMHGQQTETELVARIMSGDLPSITDTLAAECEWGSIDEHRWAELAALEPIVRKGLALGLSQRWQSAYEMEEALITAVRPASPSTVAHWLKTTGRDYLEKHDKVLAAEEASWRKTVHSTIRRTSLPGRAPTKAEEPSAGSLQQIHNRRGPQALIALLSVLVVALAVGIVMIVRNPSAQSQAAAATAPPSTQIQQVPQKQQQLLPAPAVVKAVEQPPPAPPPAVIVEEPISVGTAEARPTTTVVTPPVRKTVVRPPPVRQQVRARPPVVAPPPEVAPEAPKPKDNCTPPYYFEGNKKIFKPTCL